MATATTKSAYAYTDVRYTATRVSPTRAAVKFESRTRFADVANGGGSGSDGKYVSFFSFYVAAGLSINNPNWNPNLTPSLSSSGDLRHSSTQAYKTGCDYRRWLKHDNSMIYEPSWMPNSDFITFVDREIAVSPSDTGVDFQFALIRPDSPSTSSAEDLRWFRFTKTYTDAIRAYNDPTTPTITSLSISSDNHAAFNQAGTTISVGWAASTVDTLATLDKYSVSVRVGGVTTLVGTTTSRTMSIDTSTLGFMVADGTVVTVLVRAADSFGRNSSSASSTLTLKAYAPTAPTVVTASPTRVSVVDMADGGTITVSWSGAMGVSAAIAKYRVTTYRKRNGITSVVQSAEVATTATNITALDSQPGDLLWFSVEAIDRYGMVSPSADSNTVDVYGAVISVRGASQWHDGIVHYHDGTRWQEAQEVLVYDGSSWRSM